MYPRIIRMIKRGNEYIRMHISIDVNSISIIGTGDSDYYGKLFCDIEWFNLIGGFVISNIREEFEGIILDVLHDFNIEVQTIKDSDFIYKYYIKYEDYNYLLKQITALYKLEGGE